jgi:hypothetical protein
VLSTARASISGWVWLISTRMRGGAEPATWVTATVVWF